MPYQDDKGESECPLILQSAYVDRENNRYGEVRSMIGPQDEINARRSALLHYSTVRQIIYEHGVVEDIDEARRELAKRDGAIEIQNSDARLEIVNNSMQVQGHAELLQEAKSEIDNQAANNALQGRASGSALGRAIIASQQGGLIEVTPLTDRHRQRLNQNPFFVGDITWISSCVAVIVFSSDIIPRHLILHVRQKHRES